MTTSDILQPSASSPSAPTEEAAAPAPKTGRPPVGRAPAALVALPLLVWFGDRLFFAASFGPALPLFILAIAAAIVVSRNSLPAIYPAALLGAALLALAETINLVTIGYAVLALAIFAIPPGRLAAGSDGARLAAVARFVGLGPLRAPFNLWRTGEAEAAAGGIRRRFAIALSWLLPVALGLAFLVLFSYANPLIATAFERLNPIVALAGLSAGQPLLWLVLACFAWPFLRADIMAGRTAEAAGTTRLVPTTGTAFRVLGLSNAVFAVQTLTDLVNLWPGALGFGAGLVLPEGKTFADYAHEGAYPLLVAACLAAAIILAVMREGVPASRLRPIRVLVYLWVGQTLLLLASAALRLDLYVDAYALTRLRLYSFVWMGLVAAGLVLIVARMVLEKSNAWLVRANLAVLAVVLAVAGLANVDRFIAGYNVSHSNLAVAGGPKLDLPYLRDLGADALPAIARLLAGDIRRSEEAAVQASLDALRTDRDRLVRSLAADLADWRLWNFRDWRLMRAYGAAVPSAGPVD